MTHFLTVCILIRISHQIYGIKMGYRGFYEPQYRPWLRMTPESVYGISGLGGTILGSSRGGFDAAKIIDACLAKGINQVYVIGGDGSHRALGALYDHARARELKIGFIGIPKTIDNDIGIIDRYDFHITIISPIQSNCLIQTFLAFIIYSARSVSILP
jgi:6-phosphofructokinase